MPSHTTTTPTVTPTDIMRTIHSGYRRELRLAGGVVRGVPEGDTARARVVTEHLELVALGLHHHHTLEDEMVWPRLLERVPEELAPIVHLMESQHAAVDRLLAEAAEARSRWAAHAAAADRDELAGLLDELYLHLAEHLDAEEERLMPIAERTITPEEWAELGEAGRRSVPRSQMALVLGMYAYEGDPAVIAHMLADAPPPVRWIVPRLATRAFAKRARTVHGTATP